MYSLDMPPKSRRYLEFAPAFCISVPLNSSANAKERFRLKTVKSLDNAVTVFFPSGSALLQGYDGARSFPSAVKSTFMMFPVSFRYFSSCESLTYLPGAPFASHQCGLVYVPAKKFLMESVSISGKRRIPHLLRIVSAGFSWHTSSTVECAEPSSSVFQQPVLCSLTHFVRVVYGQRRAACLIYIWFCQMHPPACRR